MRLKEVEAAGEWQVIKTWYPVVDSYPAITFTYDSHYSYRFRINGTRFYCSISDLSNTVIWDAWDYNDTWIIDGSDLVMYVDCSKLSHSLKYKVSVDYWSGTAYADEYVIFERQLNNTDPTLTLTSPSANSPLLGRQASVRGVV